MTERAHKFDGFERPQSADPRTLGALDRILEALGRCKHYLPEAAAAKLAQLWDPDNLLGMAFVLAVWGGLQFTPVGWLADALLAATGFVAMAGNFLDLVKAAVHAAGAEDDPALDQAAQEMASALSQTVIDALLALLGSAAFSRLRRLLRIVRKKLLPRRFGTSSERPLTLGERLTAAPQSVGTVKAGEAIGEVKKKLEDEADQWGQGLRWGVAAVGGVVLVSGVVALATSGKEAP